MRNKEINKEFRLVGQSFLLTYENSSNYTSNDFEQLLRMKFYYDTANQKLHYIIVNEISDFGYNHFHVVLKFEKKRDIRNVKFFDLNGTKHPNIRKIHKRIIASDYEKYEQEQKQEKTISWKCKIIC